ncbi:MAG: zinc-dependent metalloprotease [Pseudomonadota bacterium]
MRNYSSAHRFPLTAIAAAALLAAASASAQTPPEPAPTPAPSQPTAATTPAAAPSPGAIPAERPDAAAPKPFKDVIKGAQEKKGYLTLYQKDEKTWIEILPEQLNKPFFFSANITNSVGERGLYGSQMSRSHMVVFKRVGNVVQLIAKNTAYTARPGTPQAHAVAQGFSDSLLAAAPVASGPNPATKGILVEANALLFSDIPSYATNLENAFRLPYTLDPRNTSISSARASEEMTGFAVNAHFAVPKISPPPLMLTPSPVPYTPPPQTTPDARSMFVGFYYSFAPLPANLMAPRLADARIGHFATRHNEFNDDVKPKNSVHMVNRWRLEKKDPSLALSEPVKPITFWLDKNIPEKYRASVTAGVLEWNKAFEKIGFKNALVARQQTEKDDFDTLDSAHASVRWFVGSDVGFAIGPSRVDPRSGEILDADIGMSEVFGRGARRMIAEDAHAAHGERSHDRCDYANESGHEMDFALDVLDARGELGMDSDAADKLAQAYVKNVIVHEVGHTIGLRHNFRSSTIYSLKQISDPAFSSVNGLTGSVMDYTPFNIAAKGEKQGEYVMSTLGPYDYWAVEYAYKPIAPDAEKAELARIAARSTEPLLAFGTDEDSSVSMSMSDPEVNVFDLGGDPLLYFRKRLALSREIWDRLQTKQIPAGESYGSLRRSFDYNFGQFARSVPAAAKYVGGVVALRDHAGTTRATFTPVAAARQREALDLITRNLFNADSFKFTPELVSRLSGDPFERADRRDVSVSSTVLALQTSTLNMLMNDAVATRLIDSQEKVRDSKSVLGLGELYENIQGSIWSELKTGKDIPASRRNLQREHLKRVAATLVRPAPTTPSDVLSLQRENALALQRQIRGVMNRPMTKESSAHLADSYNTLGEALKASIVRTSI